MTKHLQAYRIGRSTNERVSSKSFSGATCKDMKHYIVSTLEKKPDELILHIGTNDLKDRAPKEVVRDIMALKDFIVKKSPRTKVTISELTLRTDNKKINDKVTKFNELLKKACINSKLTVIEHTDIGDQCVNQSGVHLNKKGTSLFALSIYVLIMTFNILNAIPDRMGNGQGNKKQNDETLAISSLKGFKLGHLNITSFPNMLMN